MTRRAKFIVIACILLLLGAGIFVATRPLPPVPYQIHSDRKVLGIAFSPDSKMLALGGDTEVILWDVASRKKVASLNGHSRPVRCVAFSPDGNLLASGSEDHTVRLWDMPGGEEVATLEGHTGKVNSVAFSPDGKVLASGASQRPILRLWDVAGRKQKTDLKLWLGVDEKGKPANIEEHDTDEVRCVAFRPDGKVLAVAKTGAGVVTWDLTTGKGDTPYLDNFDVPDSVAFSADGKLLAHGNFDRTSLQIWDVTTGKKVLSGKVNPAGYRNLSFAADGKTIATFYAEVQLWDATTGKERAVLQHGKRTWLTVEMADVTALAFSPDGQTLVTGADDGSIILWKMADVLKDSE
jgi:WD40 repeat protein